MHVATVKGKGFAPAEDGGLEGMERWHAAKPKSIANGIAAPAPPRARRPTRRRSTPPSSATRSSPSAAATARVVGITAAMNSGTGLNILQKAMPERYFDVGIAEQQAILFAAGLALEGVKPVAAIYSTFLQRAFDQIVHDVCLQKLNVVFALDRAGLVGDDGPTHHGVFDIAYLRPLPNIMLMAPRDEAMLVHMLRTALLHDDGPVALRYPRGERHRRAAAADARADRDRHRRDPARGRRQGRDRRLRQRRRARRWTPPTLLAEHGIDATVADARFAKPIDAALMVALAAEHELLVTVEEGVLAGGFGSAVWETLNDLDVVDARILRVGLPDRYVTHGTPAQLYEEVGFTGRAIAERILAAVAERAIAGASAVRRPAAGARLSRWRARRLGLPRGAVSNKDVRPLLANRSICALASSPRCPRVAPVRRRAGRRVRVLQVDRGRASPRGSRAAAVATGRVSADAHARPRSAALLGRRVHVAAGRLGRAWRAERGQPRQRACSSASRAGRGLARRRSGRRPADAAAAVGTCTPDRRWSAPTARAGRLRRPLAVPTTLTRRWRRSPSCATTGSRTRRAPAVLVGDLSRPGGGPFGSRLYGGLGHASHQNGLRRRRALPARRPRAAAAGERAGRRPRPRARAPRHPLRRRRRRGHARSRRGVEAAPWRPRLRGDRRAASFGADRVEHDESRL